MIALLEKKLVLISHEITYHQVLHLIFFVKGRPLLKPFITFFAKGFIKCFQAIANFCAAGPIVGTDRKLGEHIAQVFNLNKIGDSGKFCAEDKCFYVLKV